VGAGRLGGRLCATREQERGERERYAEPTQRFQSADVISHSTSIARFTPEETRLSIC